LIELASCGWQHMRKMLRICSADRSKHLVIVHSVENLISKDKYLYQCVHQLVFYLTASFNVESFAVNASRLTLYDSPETAAASEVSQMVFCWRLSESQLQFSHK
jgi:hypothetical protein